MPEMLTASLPFTVKTENCAAFESRWTVRFEAPGPLMEMLLLRAGNAVVKSILPARPEAKPMISWLSVVSAFAWPMASRRVTCLTIGVVGSSCRVVTVRLSVESSVLSSSSVTMGRIPRRSLDRARDFRCRESRPIDARR